MSGRAKGIFCIVASAFGFALMAMFVRLCDDYGGAVSSIQKSLFRNLIALAIAAGVFFRSRRSGSAAALSSLPRKAWLMLLARSCSGVFGIFGNFYALSKMPIGEAMALNKMAPFFTVIGAALILRERVTRRAVVSLAVAFAGAMLVMKPGFRGEATFATVCALVGGLGAGIAYVFVRELGMLKVDGSIVVLFFSAFSTLVTLPFIAGGIDPMTPAQILIMLGAGCGAAIGQFGVTAAYRFAQPRNIAVFDYTNVIFTSLFGLLIFSQVPDILSVLGFALIVLASVHSSSKI